MSRPTEPQAPESLPKYLADGLPNQDDETLEDVQVYIEALLNYRELLSEEPIGEEDSHGTILHEYRTCGDESCQCMSGGEKHGPYRYRVSRDGDTIRKEYLGKAESE